MTLDTGLSSIHPRAVSVNPGHASLVGSSILQSASACRAEASMNGSLSQSLESTRGESTLSSQAVDDIGQLRQASGSDYFAGGAVGAEC